MLAQAAYLLTVNLWVWLPVILFGLVVGGLGLWVLWLNFFWRR